MDERSRHRQFEDDFLNQVRERARALLRSGSKADGLLTEPTPEGLDAVRAELGRLRVYDRDVLERLAGTRSLQLTYMRNVLGGLFRRPVQRIRVRTLAPVEALLNDQPVGPASREDVLDALAQYQVLPRRARPDVVVLASATGFSPEARRLVDSTDSPRLVLLGGRADGGWDAAVAPQLRRTPWAKLAELESRDDRLKRLLYHLEKNALVVDTRGVSTRELSEQLGLSTSETQDLIRRACRADARLFTISEGGELHLCRSPLAEEGNTMSMLSRIRRWLRLKPTAAEQVRELTAQRARIERERYAIDQKTDGLEAQERDLLRQGAAARSDAERKQLAGKLVRVRRELGRVRSQSQVLTNQIDIIGTQIHHVTLKEQGRRVALPSAEELTREAASAEQVMAELSANADLARGIEVSAESPQLAEEEAAILEEFKQAAAESAGQPVQRQSADREAASGEADKSGEAAIPRRSESESIAARSSPARQSESGLPPLPEANARSRNRPEAG